jgi:hypothetical protein
MWRVDDGIIWKKSVTEVEKTKSRRSWSKILEVAFARR